ncbi:50S ribosomal protein L25 [Candidatus Parcubacteria bacterium]|nr:MAG: 50S ribosomal protein L25 [Candidatus Parcubacteria bacterium]
MENLSLNVNSRTDLKKRVKKIREQGKIPAVLYGRKIKAKNLFVDYSPFAKLYQRAGESSLIDLVIDQGKPFKVLIQDVQRDPVKDTIIHVDFHQVKMDEKITATVPIKFVGDSAAVKNLGGTLVTNLDEIEIECLPGDLIHEIEVDISGLKTFNDLVHVKDFKLSDKVKILASPDDVVASITEPRSEEELKALDQASKAVAQAEEEAKAMAAEAETSAEAASENKKSGEAKNSEEKK